MEIFKDLIKSLEQQEVHYQKEASRLRENDDARRALYNDGRVNGIQLAIRMLKKSSLLKTLPPASPGVQIKCHVANCLCHPVCGKDTRCS